MKANSNRSDAPVKAKKNRLVRLITFIAAACFIVYSVVTVISQQAEIAQLRKQGEELELRITEQEQRNDEYNRLLSAGDEAEYMERIAVEQLGYAYPNERRFYIVEKSK